jgi:UDP-glucose 4-epimerase
MKILLTGASGFIGAQLLRALSLMFGRENVLVLTSRGELDDPRVVYEPTGFGVDPTEMCKFENIEVVVHAGAFTPKNGAQVNNIKACNSNIVFTEKLLELPFTGLKKIIYLSTVDVYGSAQLIREDSALLPATLYGFSKLYCERLVSVFTERREISHQILRIGHVYGPGEEKYEKFLPKAITSIVGSLPVELWGDGSELRSYIYIDDVVNAVINAIKLPEHVGAINVVGGLPISNRQLLDLLVRVSGKPVEIKFKEFSGTKKDYIFDNGKLVKYLLARETDLLTGLKAEVDYMASLH